LTQVVRFTEPLPATAQQNLGVDFEIKANWDNPQKWTSFALWVAELVNNPAKFYDEKD